MKSALRLTWTLVNTAPFSMLALGAALQVAGVVQQRDQHAEHGAPRARGGRRAALARSWPSIRRAIASVMSSVWRTSWYSVSQAR